VPAELALQLGHPRLQRLDHAGLRSVGCPQLHNDRRLNLDSHGHLKLTSRIEIGEQVTASSTSSSHARLPMGLREGYPTTPYTVNRPQHDPKLLNSYAPRSWSTVCSLRLEPDRELHAPCGPAGEGSTSTV
jgi:hypothetical protein